MTTLPLRRHAAAMKPTVDYPRRGEVIATPSYTLRVSAPAAAKHVEVSIDEGLWWPCRRAAGHWWYDWWGYAGGPHSAAARMSVVPGRWLRGEAIKFFASLPEA